MKVLVAWTAFTAFGAAGYLLYRKGKSLEAAGCIAIYSISGLISSSTMDMDRCPTSMSSNTRSSLRMGSPA
jgi:hypothetical protein